MTHTNEELEKAIESIQGVVNVNKRPGEITMSMHLNDDLELILSAAMDLQSVKEANRVANELIGNQAQENDKIVSGLQSQLSQLKADCRVMVEALDKSTAWCDECECTQYNHVDKCSVAICSKALDTPSAQQILNEGKKE